MQRGPTKTIRYFVLTHLLAVLAASRASVITSGEGKWEDEKGRSHLAVIVENPYYVLTVVPEMGGKVMSWKDKEPLRPGGEFVR